MQRQSELMQGQSELMRVYHERENAQEERLRESAAEFQASIAAVDRKLENTTRQVGLVLGIVNELKPALPMLQRGALVSHLLLGPPYRAGRFLYRLLTRGGGSDRS